MRSVHTRMMNFQYETGYVKGQVDAKCAAAKTYLRVNKEISSLNSTIEDLKKELHEAYKDLAAAEGV